MAVLGASGTQCKVLRNAAFTSYMRRYHTSWHAFALRKRAAVQVSEIILVSGWVKTSDWALAAVVDYSRSHEILFQAGVESFASARFHAVFTSEGQMSMEQRCRPPRPLALQDNPAKDQCLF